MCCFSQRVNRVSNTTIFARGGDNGHQLLVYGMQVAADRELAMVLPIPVAKHSGEDAVRFISLEGYPDFFQAMNKGCFPPPPPSRSTKGYATLSAAAQPLRVQQVGSFDASFVPTLHDFGRLDARFRIPEGVWRQIPGYGQFGFAVFKLRSGDNHYHPMAFEFPRARPYELFFPTIHIHDGRVHNTAMFDHTLFCQKGSDDQFKVVQWVESRTPAAQFMKISRCQGVVRPELHCYARKILGRQPNQDTILA